MSKSKRKQLPGRRKTIDRSFLPFCTPIQREIVEALEHHKTINATARALKMHPTTMRSHLLRLRRRAAARGHNPNEDEEGIAPDGFHTYGKSILYRVGEDGKQTPALVWHKTARDRDARERLLHDALAETFAAIERSPAKPIKRPDPRRLEADLLTVLPIGDPHVGMHAWGEETGDDFDLDIAKAILRGAADKAIDLAPPSEECLILNLGDLLHADNRASRTKSGHILDVDTRWTKVLRAAIDCMVYFVQRALQKHARVKMINNIGNHDEHSSLAVSLCMDRFFSQEPRVDVDTSSNPIKLAAEFGEVMITTSHGDTIKPERVPLVMATDYADVWGRTRYRYHHGGHVHHMRVHEFAGMVVECHRTLAAKDHYAHTYGFRSGRSLDVITYHKKLGEVERHRVGIRRLQSA